MDANYPNETVDGKLAAFYNWPSKDAATLGAIGYKTELLLRYANGEFGVGEWYGGDASVLGPARTNTRVVCLARLNVLARTVARVRKAHEY